MSGPMVKAILEGRKTQTRRVVFKDGNPDCHMPWWCRDHWQDGDELLRCRYGIPVYRLWVRETWARREDVHPDRERDRAIHYLKYRADADDLDMEWHNYGKWRPSIFMPRWASRITLEITGVRVERLNDISEDDALADGGWEYRTCPVHKAPVQSFAQLWDGINGKSHPWASNPWVWVIEFAPATARRARPSRCPCSPSRDPESLNSQES